MTIWHGALAERTRPVDIAITDSVASTARWLGIGAGEDLRIVNIYINT